MDEAVRRWRMQRSTVVGYVEALVSLLYGQMTRGERVSILDEIGAAVTGDNPGDLDAVARGRGATGAVLRSRVAAGELAHARSRVAVHVTAPATLARIRRPLAAD